MARPRPIVSPTVVIARLSRRTRRQHVGGRRADRHAHAELAGAARDQVAAHAVQADHRDEGAGESKRQEHLRGGAEDPTLARCPRAARGSSSRKSPAGWHPRLAIVRERSSRWHRPSAARPRARRRTCASIGCPGWHGRYALRACSRTDRAAPSGATPTMSIGFESAVAGIGAELQQLADRILIREQTFGERLVDDHRRRAARAGFFRRREFTARSIRKPSVRK